MPSAVRIKAKKLSTELLKDPVIVANFRTLEDRVIALESIVADLTGVRAVAESDIITPVTVLATAHLFAQVGIAVSGNRPVLIQALPNFARTGSYPLIKVSNAAGATASGRADVLRNDITILASNPLITAVAVAAVQLNIPTQVFTCVDNPPAGAHVYSFYFTPISGVLSADNFFFRVEEI